MNIGENLKKIRKSKGMTQEKLSNATKISITSIQRYELGKRQPNIETVKKFADALGVPMNELLGMNVVSNDIGTKIKSAKIFRGLDDESLSKLTGIDELQLRAIQDGKINPTKSELETIIKALNLSADYFEKGSPINIDKDGNIEDKYNIDGLQFKFGLNKANMTHEELCALIHFYQNQNFNLSKKIKEISQIINSDSNYDN